MRENANDNIGKKEFTLADIVTDETPSLLCSGCWPLEELEAYLKQSREKRESDEPPVK